MSGPRRFLENRQLNSKERDTRAGRNRNDKTNNAANNATRQVARAIRPKTTTFLIDRQGKNAH